MYPALNNKIMKHGFLKWALTIFVFASICISCKKEYDAIDVIDSRNIQAYIQQNNLNNMRPYNNTGIYYQVLNSGTGAPLQYSDKVPLVYTVRSLDGKYVSVDTFSVSNRYASFLGYFKPDSLAVLINKNKQKRNGSIRIILPSQYAYGKNGIGAIPGNASLDYTIHTLDETKQSQYDDQVINTYLTANKLTGFTKSAGGVYYKIANQGTTGLITSTSTVTLEYTGQLFNGSVFIQALSGAGISFKLNTTLPGWQEILPLIQQGGSVRMIIPSASGYGFPDPNNPNVYMPYASVPAFSCLDFNIKVVTVAN